MLARLGCIRELFEREERYRYPNSYQKAAGDKRSTDFLCVFQGKIPLRRSDSSVENGGIANFFGMIYFRTNRRTVWKQAVA